MVIYGRPAYYSLCRRSTLHSNPGIQCKLKINFILKNKIRSERRQNYTEYLTFVDIYCITLACTRNTWTLVKAPSKFQICTFAVKNCLTAAAYSAACAWRSQTIHFISSHFRHIFVFARNLEHKGRGIQWRFLLLMPRCTLYLVSSRFLSYPLE